jgi:hypothetical protein
MEEGAGKLSATKARLMLSDRLTPIFRARCSNRLLKSLLVLKFTKQSPIWIMATPWLKEQKKANAQVGKTPLVLLEIFYLFLLYHILAGRIARNAKKMLWRQKKFQSSSFSYLISVMISIGIPRDYKVYLARGCQGIYPKRQLCQIG